MLVLKSTNLTVRFGLEMTLLTATALWSWRTVSTQPARLVASAGAPAAIALVWILVVHGPAVPSPLRHGAELTCFATAIAAVWQLGHPSFAIVLAVTAAANGVLLTIWQQ